MGGFPSGSFGGYEMDRNRIHAMPGIFVGESFSQKNVSQVSFTMSTNDLCSSTVCIGFPDHGTFDFIIKAGPSAVTVEFIVRPVKLALKFQEQRSGPITWSYNGRKIVNINT